MNYVKCKIEQELKWKINGAYEFMDLGYWKKKEMDEIEGIDR